MFFGIKIKSATLYLFLYFFLLALFGSLLLQLPFFYADKNPVPYIDSLFTTVSAICVTGLSTVDIKIFSDAGLIILLFLIEAGGLGLVSFFTIYLVFSAKKISLLNRRIIYEYFTEDSQIEVRGILKRILWVTLSFQGAGALILSLILVFYGSQKPVLYGIFLSISAFCNAGFSPFSDSLVSFQGNYLLCITIAILIIAGGLGYYVISDVWGRFVLHKNRKLSLHTKLVLTLTAVLVAGGTFFFFFMEKNRAFAQLSAGKKILAAFFQSVTLRTAGFETVCQKEFSSPSTFVSVLMMLAGGSPGSMAGGLKTTTVFLVIYYVFRSINDKGSPSIFKRDIAESSFKKALEIFIRGIVLIVTMFIFLLIVEMPLLDRGIFSSEELFFEAISAYGTVGLSKGITPLLSKGGKILVILIMFAGRTGITFTVVNQISRGKSINSVSEYPTEDILVG